MIRPRLIGEFAPEDYELKSTGFMGSLHVLSVGDLSLMGEADELVADLPVTIIHLERTIRGRRFGTQWYIVTQPGGRMLAMYEGTEDTIRFTIGFDSSAARREARRMIRS